MGPVRRIAATLLPVSPTRAQGASGVWRVFQPEGAFLVHGRGFDAAIRGPRRPVLRQVAECIRSYRVLGIERGPGPAARVRR